MASSEVRRRDGYHVDGGDHVDVLAWSAGLSRRTAVFAWIAWYGRLRLRSANDYLPPIEWEQHHAAIGQPPSTVAA